MPAPQQLHAALDALYEAQDVTVVGDDIVVGQRMTREQVNVVMEHLLAIPNDDVPACREAVPALEAIMRGIASGAVLRAAFDDRTGEHELRRAGPHSPFRPHPIRD